MTRTARLLVVAAAAASTACGSGDGAGDRLPDVEIVSLTTDGGAGDGGATSLADIDGPAVINLWATWCPPCRAEIPDFEEVHRARHDEVRFVGVNIGEDAAPAAEFLASVDVTYDQFRDPEGYVVTELRTTAMPVTIVIDGDGAVSRQHLGPMDADELNRAIDEALGVTSSG